MRKLSYLAGTALLLAAPVFGQQKPKEGWYVFHSFGTPTAMCRVSYNGGAMATQCVTRDVEMYAKQGELVFFRNPGTYPGYVEIGYEQGCSDKRSVETLIRSRCIEPYSQEAREMRSNFNKVAGNVITPGNLVSEDYGKASIEKIHR